MIRSCFDGRKWRASLLILLLSILLLIACGDGPTEPDEPSSVHSIEVSPDPVTVRDLGNIKQFQAVARDEDGNRMPDVSFTWTGTPDSVVTVDDEGTAMPEGNGSAIIEASASGLTGTARMLVRAGDLTWTEVKGGFIHTCGVTSHGTAACRGDNVHGELGNGDTSAVRLDLVKVQAPLLYFKHITLGGGHTCAIAHDKTAYCWGSSGHGEGGYGETIGIQTTPVKVHGHHSFTQITTGGGHTCGLTTDGEAYCWGNNNNGQLGDGSTTNRSTPVQVTGGLTFAQINAASEGGGTYSHTCGVATGGTAYCWGNNINGQLGDGSTSNRNEPTPVDTDVAFTQVTAGQDHTCGITTQGTAYCWGLNDRGALGDGTTENRLKPVEVEGGHTFRSITAGSAHTCGLTPDGTVLCWGKNSQGQLGDGTKEKRTHPVNVAGEHVFTQFHAGGLTSVGVDEMGTGYYWGQKGNFFEGSSTNTPTALPNPGEID